MEKIKIHREYILTSGSIEMLWNMISMPSGLELWFADKVTVDGKLYTFQWANNETRTARLMSSHQYSYIRFHWTDEERGTFFELKMDEDELTGDYILTVTDFVEKGDEDEMKKLWNTQIADLKREAGI